MEENNKHRGGFEHSDINELAVGKVGVALLLVTIAAMALLLGLFSYFKSQEGGKAVSEDPTKVFPQPQLETHPAPELKQVLDEQNQMLNSYGWVDQQKGVVRIPIDRAMDMVVQKGLPVRVEPPSAPNVSVPTESGLGPKMIAPGGPLAFGVAAAGKGTAAAESKPQAESPKPQGEKQ